MGPAYLGGAEPPHIAVGLFLFLMILLSVWRALWAGRAEWSVRIAGAYLVCPPVFSGTGGFLVFCGMELKSGFAWIILGTGVGASLRAAHTQRVHGHAR